MIRLCGTSISNYYNKTKLALLEKGIAFEEVMAPPSQEPGMLAHSPMGKVPFLEVGGQYLSESQAIVEYLEETHPSTPLYPKDAWQRAKVRELMQIMELYIDWPGRPLIGTVFFGAPVSEESKAQIWSAWERGIKAFNRVAKFAPFVAGDTLTYADCAAYFHLPLASILSKAVYGKDVTDGIPGAAAYLERMRARPQCQRVSADQGKALEAFMASKKKS